VLHFENCEKGQFINCQWSVLLTLDEL